MPVLQLSVQSLLEGQQSVLWETSLELRGPHVTTVLYALPWHWNYTAQCYLLARYTLRNDHGSGRDTPPLSSGMVVAMVTVLWTGSALLKMPVSLEYQITRSHLCQVTHNSRSVSCLLSIVFTHTNTRAPFITAPLLHYTYKDLVKTVSLIGCPVLTIFSLSLPGYQESQVWWKGLQVLYSKCEEERSLCACTSVWFTSYWYVVHIWESFC